MRSLCLAAQLLFTCAYAGWLGETPVSQNPVNGIGTAIYTGIDGDGNAVASWPDSSDSDAMGNYFVAE